MHNLVLADQCRHNFLVHLQSLEHVKATLKSGLVIGLQASVLGLAQLHKDFRQLDCVVEDTELEHLVKPGELFRLKEVAQDHGLKSRLQWNTVLENRVDKLHDNS